MAERAHQRGRSPHPTGTAATEDLPVKAFRDRKTWEEWLAKHHDSRGVWLKLAKKGATARSLRYPEALEVALCYGWIDGQGKGLDEQSWFVRFGPRRARSEWSRINRARVEELIRQGRMRPAGLAAIETAKRTGRWDKTLT